jgi:pseudaminic acid cytidylyltransferase
VNRIAIIPARGGSQRVPLKNIREFLGTPMLVRTINTLKDSKCFSRVIVSTDHEEIAEMALASGAEVPFLRSKELSENYTPTIDVIADSIYQLQSSKDDAICCVYATNPFLRADALRLGLKVLLDSKEINYVTTVTTFPFPIQRALCMQPDGKLQMAIPEYMMTHSQDLEERFHECAQFWWARASTWTSKVGMQSNVAGICLPRWMVQDIDTFEDWEMAEVKFEILMKTGKFDSYVVDEKNILMPKIA